MSTKIKKKSDKTKTKKIKRAPLKESYNDEEKVELKNKYTDILFHLSNFLSEHNVYEAVPENVKILVFSSELSFYEMIKVFIFEDIYCGLIYDSKLNNYLGLITTRDLMILYKYIIDNFPSEEITDFNCYIKEIFSKKIGKKEQNITDNNINNNINIFEYLQNVNYIDYLIYVKRIEFQNINLLSVSLDDNLLETLQKINIKNIHRLLVEEDNKNGKIINLPKKKSSKKIEEKEKEIKKQEINEQKKQKRNSKTEKTSTTNYSDEESKNNVMFGKRDIKQIEEINKDKIIEEKAIEESKGSDNIIVLPEEKKEETKHTKKKVVKKKKKVEEQNKPEENTKQNNNTHENPKVDENQNNNDDNNKSTDEVKTKKKKIIKKKKKEGHPIDNINKINTVETEPNKEEKIKEEKETKDAKEPEKEKEKEENEELKPKKKKIIKKKKKPNEENMETTETTQTIPESKTDDELGAKTKKIVKKRAKTARKTTTDVPNLIKKEEKNIEEKIEEEKKIVKKKIIKKKVIKKKKKEDISVDNININNEQSKKERPETAQEKVKLDLKVENSVEKSDNNETVRSATEAGEEPSSEKKDKYELPKIKMKRKSTKQGTKKTEDKGKEIESKNNNEEKTENKDGQTDKKESENKEIVAKEPEIKENENKEEDSKENNDKKINEEENNIENKKEELKETIGNMEKKEEAKEETIISDNKLEDNKKEDIENNEDNIEKKEEESEDKIEEKDEEKEIKNETDIIAEILQKTHLEEMRNYIGIVTNETIFEYLFLNYYSNEMKEFDLSLNELLVLGDIPLVKKLDNGKDMNEKVYQTFNTYLFTNNSDIIPIFNNKEIEGFIYPKDFLYYIYNCESNQSLTNEEFLINIYKDIDEEKPYGKNRVIFLELNDKNKSLYVKELIEKLNCSIEKKIVIYDPSNNNNLYLISLRTIFRAIAEFESNKK